MSFEERDHYEHIMRMRAEYLAALDEERSAIKATHDAYQAIKAANEAWEREGEVRAKASGKVIELRQALFDVVTGPLT